MIPKKIHYCWFGRGDITPLATKCIESWKKYLPDYEIVLWNEDNFDINRNEYVKQAYKSKKYAFVSDYARLYVLYNEGGIYMDVDVEVLKPIDCFLKHEAFMGFENEVGVAPGLILGAEKGNSIIKEIMDVYSTNKFVLSNGKYNLTTIVQYTTDILLSHGLVLNGSLQNIKGIVIYPKTYFCPLTYDSDRTDFSEKTYTIHHFAASWISEKDKRKARRKKILKNNIIKLIGEVGFDKLKTLMNFIVRKSE